LAFNVDLSSTDVVRLVATLSGPGIATPISADLELNGSSATGAFSDLPPGAGRTLKIEAFPALGDAPEAGIAIYRGQAIVTILAGQLTNVPVILFPVAGDVAVTAFFPPSDVDNARIHHVGVVVSGTRIVDPPTYFLTIDPTAERASGTAAKIPVGLDRTVSVSTFTGAGTLIHQGSIKVDVTEQGVVTSIPVANLDGNGQARIDAGFCVPSCGQHICGDDTCGGSCGGCLPGTRCASGSCTDFTIPTEALSSPNQLIVAENTVSVSGTSFDNVNVTDVVCTVNQSRETLAVLTGAGTVGWTAAISLSGGSNAIECIAHDFAGNASLPTVAVAVFHPTTTGDSVPPTNQIGNNPGNTFLPTVAVGGNATDNVEVTGVMCMNDPDSGSHYARVAIDLRLDLPPFAVWSVEMPLDVGNNHFSCAAFDAAGNTSGWSQLFYNRTP
jgi:hypothetical protein